ncbi:hypothetical protein C8R43DRAFT_1238949 [Mycena crocata]|nr:hypothetical protein C8R43DRAFT_1238949 [Mycena crocata]
MTRFKTVTYNKTSKYQKQAPDGVVTFRAAMLWDDIYAVLDLSTVTVVGARVVGVGAAGFLLGGGYSFHSNQYGMAVDNIVAFEISSQAWQTVTATFDPEFFWALKGGLDKIMLGSSPDSPCAQLRALVAHTNQAQAYKAALEVYNATSKESKAALVFGLNSIGGATRKIGYDGPKQPAGIFDAFLNIPGALVNNGTYTNDFAFPSGVRSINLHSRDDPEDDYADTLINTPGTSAQTPGTEARSTCSQSTGGLSLLSLVLHSVLVVVHLVLVAVWSTEAEHGAIFPLSDQKTVSFLITVLTTTFGTIIPPCWCL